MCSIKPNTEEALGILEGISILNIVMQLLPLGAELEEGNPLMGIQFLWTDTSIVWSNLFARRCSSYPGRVYFISNSFQAWRSYASPLHAIKELCTLPGSTGGSKCQYPYTLLREGKGKKHYCQAYRLGHHLMGPVHDKLKEKPWEGDRIMGEMKPSCVKHFVPNYFYCKLFLRLQDLKQGL